MISACSKYLNTVWDSYVRTLKFFLRMTDKNFQKLNECGLLLRFAGRGSVCKHNRGVFKGFHNDVTVVHKCDVLTAFKNDVVKVSAGCEPE
jgi:hypothetical protein